MYEHMGLRLKQTDAEAQLGGDINLLVTGDWDNFNIEVTPKEEFD